jgi:hypothetical protein
VSDSDPEQATHALPREAARHVYGSDPAGYAGLAAMGSIPVYQART